MKSDDEQAYSGGIRKNRRLIRILFLTVGLVTSSFLISPFSSEPVVATTYQRWSSPIDSNIIVARQFDPPAQKWLSGHRGVDLDVDIGAAVYAVNDGTIVYAGNLAGRYVISVEHDNGLRSTFEPVEPVVSKGQTVSRGDLLGYVVEGHSPGALHWGARTGSDTYTNPLLLLLGVPVLKPWEP